MVPPTTLVHLYHQQSSSNIYDIHDIYDIYASTAAATAAKRYPAPRLSPSHTRRRTNRLWLARVQAPCVQPESVRFNGDKAQWKSAMNWLRRGYTPQRGLASSLKDCEQWPPRDQQAARKADLPGPAEHEKRK